MNTVLEVDEENLINMINNTFIILNNVTVIPLLVHLNYI